MWKATSSIATDENGIIEQIKDYVSADPQTGLPLTQDFQYDTLGCLTYAIGHYGGRGNYNPETYNYNSVTGNLSSKAGVAYTYSTTYKHAVTALSSGNAYQYDSNGNMTQRTVSGQTYNFGYDAENHLTAVSGAAQVSFDYNGDGQRVVATEGVTTTVFVGNYFEFMDSQVGRRTKMECFQARQAVQIIRDVRWKNSTAGRCGNGQVQRIRAPHL